MFLCGGASNEAFVVFNWSAREKRVTKIETTEEFDAFVAEVEAEAGYQRPRAFAIGIGFVNEEGTIHLDAFFPVVNYRENYGTAAVLAAHLGVKRGVGTYSISRNALRRLLESHFAPFLNDGKRHENIEAIKSIVSFVGRRDRRVPRPLVTFIPEEASGPGPQDVGDAYLRLHLLSLRRVKPHEINLDGLFAILPNVAWTSEGPIALPDLAARQLAARMNGTPLVVHSIDKFPRMADYVVPSGVRIGDASRVRLGAYLGEGTTVMHEGFVNFNAGTLGKSMVEGRISAGVTVDDGSDLGGSASLMGTLSGGGTEVIKVGKNCLIGANGGIGISLGDMCTVEASCYVTAGAKVLYFESEGAEPITVKGKELSGRDGLMFWRNSVTGALEARPNTKVIALNEDLHAHQ